MFLSPEKTAESFGITVQKLETMRKHKDCPKSLVDSEGFYDTEKVETMLNRLKRVAEKAACTGSCNVNLFCIEKMRGFTWCEHTNPG